jgi:NTP pyrophosphatase (non-canonical NTP hydrolase)
MDIFKWDTPKSCEQNMSNKESRQDAIDELADIIIYAIAFANKNNIDISKAVSKKMIKNRIKYPTDKFKGNF